jgi:mannitol-1-phosphate/altronate dehydrogenase
MAKPGTKIVSLTVTEKGYCCDLPTGQLDTKHPGVSWLQDSNRTNKLERLFEGDAP